MGLVTKNTFKFTHLSDARPWWELTFDEFSVCLILSDTFMVEDAVEAIGFGTFQWKLSILTGLSWVNF